MGDLKRKLEDLVNNFRRDYPSVNFTTTRDQTELLDYSISNLTDNLIFGALLAFIVMFFFLKDFKSPLLIGITMPASLIITLIFFRLLDISINIISLSGLLLGLGMMIDNSIIVIDNIAQHRDRGHTLVSSCVNGTKEVLKPMLSSMLTSCAVFLPLIFLSGIAGAIFYDQAVAVSAGHLASILVSVIVIPVYYHLIHKRGKSLRPKQWLERINTLDYEALYERTFRWVMKHQPVVWIIVFTVMTAGLVLFFDLTRSKLPTLTKDETLVAIDWNEAINVDENKLRVQKFVSELGGQIEQNTCMIAEQQYFLNRSTKEGPAESVVYLKAKSADELRAVQKKATAFFISHYPAALFRFVEAGNLFNLLFPEEEPTLIAQLRPKRNGSREAQNNMLRRTLDEVQQFIPEKLLDKPSIQDVIILRSDPVKMMIYDIPIESLYKKLAASLNQSQVLHIVEDQDFIPVVLGGKTKLIEEILNETYVANQQGHLYPVRELVSISKGFDQKTIVAGPQGEYFPIDLKATVGEAETLIERLNVKFDGHLFYEIDFTGSFLSNNRVIIELSMVLLVSLLLLYFILASQFESLSLPLIVLLEVPIDIAGSFFFLKTFDAGINLMSLIGIVVMTGIIVNDSILKIDTVNQLRSQGYSVLKALLVAGQRRLKPILMTSITTVLAMLPLLFASGIGAELQKPLILALTGGLVLGTLVSLYFIPLCYFYLKRDTAKSNVVKQHERNITQ